MRIETVDCRKCGAPQQMLTEANRTVVRCTNQRCPKSDAGPHPARMSLADIEPHGDLVSDMRNASIARGFAMLRPVTT